MGLAPFKLISFQDDNHIKKMTVISEA